MAADCNIYAKKCSGITSSAYSFKGWKEEFTCIASITDCRKTMWKTHDDVFLDLNAYHPLLTNTAAYHRQQSKASPFKLRASASN
eukprot:scaffold2539_cov43-Prasinocladus_malaysianus.AAC.2